MSIPSLNLLTISLLVLLTGLSSSAEAEIFKCIDAAGNSVYSNTQSRNCRSLNVEPPVSRRGHGSASTSSVTANPSPSTFPKVDGGTQRARDDERRRILEQEIAAEQKNLEQARRELAEQEAVRSGDERNYQRVLDRLQPFKDRIALHERNIVAIRKEISNLR